MVFPGLPCFSLSYQELFYTTRSSLQKPNKNSDGQGEAEILGKRTEYHFYHPLIPHQDEKKIPLLQSGRSGITDDSGIQITNP